MSKKKENIEMSLKTILPVKTLAILSVVFVVACSDASTLEAKPNADIETKTLEAIELTVYKSRSCKCCQKWVTHVEEHGFEAEVNNITLLSKLKDKKGIPANYRSCHTAESNDGYVFEGHVPAKFIKQYLANVPEGSIGLSVPAMPVGSPGMEVGDRFMPYNILLINEDGTVTVYEQVMTYEEQF
tara:strand:- start:1674 stop:2228 length:555 start_codon:yes stop_codon:yes gene_type:complete